VPQNGGDGVLAAEGGAAGGFTLSISMSLFDLDAGPLTVTLPDAGKRYLSLQVTDQDHYAQVLFDSDCRIED
jgi:hypothetical protein